ncbi:XRE family transcriptional regulator [Bdellovibrio svalbardensis]|uniref:Helix-turn-helix domain-containing protein n=1 Tax=Bdellovibrio svalbardensis TaxID=2972972 RepID=A0ABT6DKJ6_9BACT|nr:XRE family transcriptional regulator [Bdellovibrio svalbardensis]MDG0817333.1 helix-turn-helix domain-containing protein [Bdellovibrio svalbardensis]
MAFPNKTKVRKVLKNLENAEGTLALSEKPTALEKFRWDICQHFLAYKRKHKCTQKQMSEIAGIDESKMSKILHHRVEEFSTDRLISIYQKLNPKVQLLVS